MIDKQINMVYYLIIHEEWRRDRPCETTATCVCKVLMSERWGLNCRYEISS